MLHSPCVQAAHGARLTPQFLNIALSQAFLIGANQPQDSWNGTTGGYNGNAVATLHYDFGMTGLVPLYAPAFGPPDGPSKRVLVSAEPRSFKTAQDDAW